jgi:MFS family permease
MHSESSPLSSLRYRNFRLLWSGQFASMIGTKMQATAILWHVTLLVPDNYKAMALGFVGLTKVIPIVVFSLFSGVFADAFDRRRVMFVTQTAMMISSLLLAVIVFCGLDTVWMLYIFSGVTAVFSSFDAPARQSMIPQLVPRNVYPNAISLNSVMMKTASVLGPAVGGIIIAVSGVKGAYVFNSLSFLAVITALILMKDVPRLKKHHRAKVNLKSAFEGFKYVFTSPLIRSTMLLDFFASFFSSATVLLPIFAQDILHVGPHGYGWLASATSIGAMVTSVAMTHYSSRIKNRGKVLLVAVLLYGAATVGFGLSTSFWLTFFFLAFSGAADTVSTVFRSIIRQLTTPDHLRGRMVSVNMMFMQGGPQLGELEAGMMAAAFGAPVSVVSGGVACIIATVITAWNTPMLRHYHSEKKEKQTLVELSENGKS